MTAVGTFNNVEEMNEQCTSKFELVKDSLSVTVTRHSKKVVGTISDGEHEYSQYVKLSDANGDYDTAVKMLVDRLLEKFQPVDVKASTFDWQAFKSGKFAVHCDTEENAKAFLKECGDHEIHWYGGKQKLESEKFFRSFGDNTCYLWSKLSNGLAQSSISHEKNVVEYIPTVREVYRPAEVGEWIKIVDADSDAHYGYNNGDIFKVDKLFLGYEKEGAVEKPYHIVSREYVVLENYQPEKPEPKPVFKKAKVGDKIKIVKDGVLHRTNVKIGDFHIVTGADGQGVWTASEYFWDEKEEYIIIEEAPKPERVMPRLEAATMDELLSEIKRRTEGKA
jgi:hypothetical protein